MPSHHLFGLICPRLFQESTGLLQLFKSETNAGVYSVELIDCIACAPFIFYGEQRVMVNTSTPSLEV